MSLLAAAFVSLATRSPHASVRNTTLVLRAIGATHWVKNPESTAGSFGITVPIGVPLPFKKYTGDEKFAALFPPIAKA